MLAATRLHRSAATLTAAALLLGACTTQEMRIGGDDGTDACRPQLVQLDSTGNFFAEDIIRGAAIGAVGGAAVGALLGYAAGGARGAGTGALIGGGTGLVVGAAGGYLAARQRQARDQAQLTQAIATDLQSENEQLDRTQRAFDLLMDCRFNQARIVRQALRENRMSRPEAEAQMRLLRDRTQRDIAFARTLNERIGTRGAEFDTAMDAVAPGVKQDYANRKAAQTRTVTAQARQDTPLRLRPDPASPPIAQVAARQPVQIRPAQSGFALVETSDGRRGFAPSDSFGAGGGQRIRIASAAPIDSGRGDIRSLAASNIARRDNFSESVGTAERAASTGFELAAG